MRVAIVYSPTGNGHRSAARAIERALHRRRGDVSVEVLDVLRFAPRSFRYDQLWHLIQQHGGRGYDRLFDATDRPLPLLPAVRARLNVALLAPLVDHLAASQPDRIVCTHFLASVALGHARHTGRLHGTLSTVVTDYLAHEAWLAPGIDRFYVASQTVADQLRARTTAPLEITGIPIDAEMDAHVAPPPSKPRVLFLASGVPWPLVRAALASVPRHVELEMVAGNDARLRERLIAERRGPVHGFVPGLRAVIDRATIVVTKAGGLVVSECLARGRAMVLPWPAPGHERGNRAHAVAVGAACSVDDPRQTGAAIDSIPWHAMGLAAAAAARRGAAMQVADDLLGSAVMRPHGDPVRGSALARLTVRR